MLVHIVVLIQTSNRKRKIAQVDQMVFLRYYWQNVKVELSKILISDKIDRQHLDLCKQVALKIFASTDVQRDAILTSYVDYCRQLYFFRFIKHREVTADDRDREDKVAYFRTEAFNIEKRLFKLEKEIFKIEENKEMKQVMILYFAKAFNGYVSVQTLMD